MAENRITLALGGGGARGLAHLGVIEILLDAGYVVERIVGVSMGALVGAAFAFEPDIQRLQQRTLAYVRSPRFERFQPALSALTRQPSDQARPPLTEWFEDVKAYLQATRQFHRALTRPSLLPGVLLRDAARTLLPKADIVDAVIPLTLVAADLLSGRGVLLEHGPVRKAARASAALPGIWPPVPFSKMLLCDIGVLFPLPTILTRSGATRCLVGVDVSSELRPVRSCDTAFDVLMRMTEIAEAQFRHHANDAADVIIRPDVSQVPWYDFSEPERLIDRGRQAARDALGQLRGAV